MQTHPFPTNPVGSTSTIETIREVDENRFADGENMINDESVIRLPRERSAEEEAQSIHRREFKASVRGEERRTQSTLAGNVGMAVVQPGKVEMFSPTKI